MGKKSREKLERRDHPAALAHGVKTGVTFRVGAEYPHPLPVMLYFAIDGKIAFPSRWRVADARVIAMALLKYCEIVEREQRKRGALDEPTVAEPTGNLGSGLGSPAIPNKPG